MAEKKIIDKIDDIHQKIYTDPFGDGGRLAQKLQSQAWEATIEGWTKDNPTKTKWKEYMCNFASNQKQLDRLCGLDDDWIAKNNWAKPSLAYIVASSTCGIITTTGTRSNLSREMVEGLDEGINATVGATDCPREELDKTKDDISYI